jgi:hypothetical protein
VSNPIKILRGPTLNSLANGEGRGNAVSTGGVRKQTLESLDPRILESHIPNSWTYYYYFYFGIGPPIGLQYLKKKAVGGWSAHGLFFDLEKGRMLVHL